MAGIDQNPSSHLAIIGDGPASLITMGVLCHDGIPAEAMTIYGDAPFPLATLTRCARAVGQTQMRSESSGHLAPVDPPGLALVDAWQHRSPWPVLTSLLDRYTPPLDLLCRQADALALRIGYNERKVTARIDALSVADEPEPVFVLADRSGACVGRARHVIVAVGHSGLAWPAWAAPWREHRAATHAYEGTTFQAGETVVVIGGGMAAAHTWVKALQSGAQVAAVHRRPLRRQHLAASRCDFSTVGIEAFQRLPPPARIAQLADLGHGTFPWRWSWERLWWRARRQARMASYQDEVVRLEETDLGRLRVELAGGRTLEADHLVCATGFVPDAAAHRLIATLVTGEHAPLEGGHLWVSDSFRLVPLERAGQVCGVVGSLARWALPVADTFAGIKFAARRLAPHLRLGG